MSGGQEDAGEKSHEPTAKKLEDARKKGDIPKSNDVGSAAAYLGLLLAILGGGAAAMLGAGNALSHFLGDADTLSTQILGSGGRQASADIVIDVALPLLPIFLLPFGLVLAAMFGQRALVFAPSKLAPQASRISPLSVARNKFGPTGLFEFSKNAVKMTVVTLVLVILLRAEADQIIGSVRMDGRNVGPAMLGLLTTLLIWVTLLGAAVALVDVVWQRFDHARKLRMSYQELRDEGKEAEGDPHLKGQRRQRGIDIATNQMLADVPTADVIIVNPTHFAVALKWSRQSGSAPVCVAKGVDEIAHRIREVAAQSGVPIHRDPPTARSIHALTEIGAEISPDMYRAVAAAIRFAEDMRRAAKKGF